MVKNIKNSSKNKIKTIILFIFCCFCFLSLFIPTTIFFINKTFFCNEEQKYEKTFDASLLNSYYSGKFTLKFAKKDNCELVATKDFKINPLIVKDNDGNEKPREIEVFNLGNGQFYDKGDCYTIQIIGKNAFKNNKNIRQHLIIPPLIKKIDDRAFAQTGIKTIYIRNQTNFLPINENVFEGCEIKTILTRNPKYKTSQDWIKICKNIISKPYTSDDYEKFLSLRTFSIGAFWFMRKNGSEHGGQLIKRGIGTGWIVDKVDRKNNNDYKYWMATNLHVSQAFNGPIIKMGDDSYNVHFACTCKEIAGGKEIQLNEIKSEKRMPRLANWKCVKIEQKNIEKIYNSKEDYNFHNELVRNHIFTDFSLIKIDFMINKRNSDLKTQILLKKLDAINRYISLNNSLNVYTPNTIEKSAKFYGIGYPAKISYGAPNQNILNYIFQKGEIINNFKNNTPRCDFYIVTAAPHEKWLLINGASGTMMIDENFSTIGIFWGGTEGNGTTDNPYQNALMFVDRFYIKENNLITKFLEI